MTQAINQETAYLIAFEEGLNLKSGNSEFLLQTGAKLYPPSRLNGWRIMGYNTKDIQFYIERYELAS